MASGGSREGARGWGAGPLLILGKTIENRIRKKSRQGKQNKTAFPSPSPPSLSLRSGSATENLSSCFNTFRTLLKYQIL